MKRKIELKIDILEKNKIAYQVKISKAKRFRLYFNSLGILMIAMLVFKDIVYYNFF